MKSKIKQYQIFIIASVVVFVLAAAVLVTMGLNKSLAAPKENADGSLSQSNKFWGSSDNSNAESTVTLVAVGDNIPHKSLSDSQKQFDGSYDFNPIFDGIRADVEGADIAVISQETILGGATADPTINSPFEIGDAIYNAGFDVVLQATNHALCSDVKGVTDNLDFWGKYPEISVLGVNATESDRENITVIEKNGIKIAMLNYTYGLDHPEPLKENPYIVNLLDEEKVKADIEKAKEKADVVIVFPHWGTEYSHKKDSEQDKWANIFYQCGVNIVIGSHSHVIQPVEWITSGENPHRMLVYYSLGNFVSGQTEADRMLGAMAKITIKKSEKGIEIGSATAVPIVTHYDTDIRNYGVYKLSNYTEEMASLHYINGMENGSFTVDALDETANEILGDFIEMQQ